MTTRFINYGNVFSPRQLYFSATGTNGKYDSHGKLKENPYDLVLIDTQWKKIQNYSAQASNGLYGRMAKSTQLQALEFKLQSKIPSAVRGHDFNLGVALAEGEQTYRLTLKALRDINDAVRMLKRGNFISAARILGINGLVNVPKSKQVAQRFLELQYGWRPLLSDIYQAWKAYSVYTNPAREWRLHVRCRTHDGSSYSLNQYIDLDTRCLGRGSAVIKLREQLPIERSLGLLDPYQAAWNWMHASFIVDWFIPIGTYLDNLNVIPAINGEIWWSRKLEYITDVNYKKFNAGLGIAGPDPQFTRHVYFNRSLMPTNAASIVKPQFKPLSKALSTEHLWNALALLRTNLRH